MSKLIADIQTLLGVKPDGEWGPISQAALDREIRIAHEVPAPTPAPAKPLSPGRVHPFIAIAAEWMGRTETSPNRFTGMQELWADTNYPSGWSDRAPYCAAFQCHIVAEAIRRGVKIKECPTSPSVSELRNWARVRGYAVKTPKPGDQFTLLPSGTSHTGLVESVEGGLIHTLEGNTNAAGSRDGDGFWRKTRRIAACDFFRIPIPA